MARDLARAVFLKVTNVTLQLSPVVKGLDLLGAPRDAYGTAQRARAMWDERAAAGVPRVLGAGVRAAGGGGHELHVLRRVVLLLHRGRGGLSRCRTWTWTRTRPVVLGRAGQAGGARGRGRVMARGVSVRRVPELPVLHEQVPEPALQRVDPVPLRLDEALLVLHDGRQLLEIQHGLEGVLQQARHDGGTERRPRESAETDRGNERGD